MADTQSAAAWLAAFVKSAAALTVANWKKQGLIDDRAASRLTEAARELVLRIEKAEGAGRLDSVAALERQVSDFATARKMAERSKLDDRDFSAILAGAQGEILAEGMRRLSEFFPDILAPAQAPLNLRSLTRQNWPAASAA